MYENSRFLKNRFTFCGVNTNFGQQWAPPAYYHLTPIVSKGKHWYVLFVVCMGCIIDAGKCLTGSYVVSLIIVWSMHPSKFSGSEALIDIPDGLPVLL